MQVKSQPSQVARIFGILVVLVAIATIAIGIKPTFAITPPERAHVSYEQIGPDYMDGDTAMRSEPQKSHAPEPATLFLFLSGICGFIVRLAQKSFEKFKRASDLFLATLGIFIASPILALAAAMIKITSPGPVIYRQTRVGKFGRIFKIYKLRTMCVDAEKDTGAIWAKQNDSRIIPAGKLLRKLHIDEIPQLFNVLKGEMSIIGPRPERPELVRDLAVLIHDYKKRLLIQPGITGIAQIYHKYDETIEDVKKKIKYDLLYIKRMCWLVDLRVLAQTLFVVLAGKR